MWKSILLIAAVAAAAAALSAQTAVVSGTRGTGDFPLVHEKSAADVWVAAEDHKVARIAAADFAADVERVTGVKPRLRQSGERLHTHAVWIGTLGRSSKIDELVRRRKLNVDGIRGNLESFLMAVVPDPEAGVRQALVIVGSDRRGTAFGVYDLSKRIGVSPWYWWADVPPRHQAALYVRSAQYTQGPPSVRYRGIFINDEDWGIRPWAGKHFDPELGDIGPKTYQRVFELLLRLKANYLWPAMHECTQAFNNYAGNKELADDYAIVMGSSHAEPMLRNNVTEWDPKTRGAWDYQTNAAGVRKYWDERATENSRFENVHQIGMRGIHDSGMPGPAGIEQRVSLLEQIFSDQRDILARRVNPDPGKVPQLFCAYKEVLQLYQAHLHVPDDVILGWADDNHGYIRQLSTPAEQKRAGGSGIYYHVSYWGAPHDYLWLNSIPPALIQEEMGKAFDYGTRSLWVLNVGDVKPAEIPMEYFLSMAWDMPRLRSENQREFLESWAGREFGSEHAGAIARILSDYYRLGFARKPEHMGFNKNEAPISRTAFNPIVYGDEAERRLGEYAALTRAAEKIYGELPAASKDAFYELVIYPVRGADHMNQKMLLADRGFLYAVQGRASANAASNLARRAFARIEQDTEYFNTTLANGKWRQMMSSAPRSLAVFDMPTTAAVTPVPGAGLGVAVEGHVAALVDRPAHARSDYRSQTAGWAPVDDSYPAMLPTFDSLTREKHFIDLFNTGTTPFTWTAAPDRAWVRLTKSTGRLDEDVRLWVDIDWDRAPTGESDTAIAIRGAGSEYKVKLRLFHPAIASPADMPRFVESGGVVSMEAEHFTRRTDVRGASWRTLENLGRTGSTVAVYPTTTPSLDVERGFEGNSPSLEYDFYVFHPGSARVLVSALPTQRIHPGRHLQYAVAIDSGARAILNLEDSAHWEEDVLRAETLGTSNVALQAPGRHTLKVWMIDPGVVLDKIVIDLGGLRTSYMGPPETAYVMR